MSTRLVASVVSRRSLAYGRGYIEGGGNLPPYLAKRDDLTAYHRNPLEAEAYTFDARYRDDSGGVVPAKLPA